VKKSDFIKLINEEISNIGFDFLGNEQQQEEDKEFRLLSDVDFQKQFICDFLLNKKDKYKVTKVVESNINDWRRDGDLNITYGVEISYYYDTTKEPARFGLWFEGENIKYTEKSNYNAGYWAGTMPDSIAPSGGDWLSKVTWKDITVSMHMIDERDDDIKFTAFERAPERVQNLFISHFLSDFIYRYGNISVNTPEQYDSIEKTGYC
jgi:hypothetical protein